MWMQTFSTTAIIRTHCYVLYLYVINNTDYFSIKRTTAVVVNLFCVCTPLRVAISTTRGKRPNRQQ